MDLSVGIILIVYAIVLIILGFMGYNSKGENKSSNENSSKKVAAQI